MTRIHKPERAKAYEIPNAQGDETWHMPWEDMHCISRGPGEPTPDEYLTVCDDNPVHLACSVHCKDTGCGGHPICDPCYRLGLERGLIREVT